MHKSVNFLYNSFFGSLVRPIFNKRLTNRLVGNYANSRLSKRHIKSFIKKYNINLSESERQEIKKYKTFNHFFTRTFPLNSRPIDLHDNAIVSPCDGYLYSIDSVTPTTTFLVKDIPFNLEKFLKNKELAEHFNGGTLFVIYLAPWHYHRFHFPVDCIPESPIRIHGKYDSVHDIVYKAGIQPLLKNERQLWLLRTFDNSIVAFVPVGALCVGKIKQTCISYQSYKKGSEAGYFAFGGSTIVMLFKKGTCIPEKKFNPTKTEIRMGERIATRV